MKSIFIEDYTGKEGSIKGVEVMPRDFAPDREANEDSTML